METLTYRNEQKNHLLKVMSPEDISLIACGLWSNDQIKELANDISQPMDCYVLVFVGLTGQTEINEDQFIQFLKSAIVLRNAVKHEQTLIQSYRDLEPVDRATPILAIDEIIRLMLMAVFTGAASGVGKTLIEQFLSTRKDKNVDVLVHLLMSSPIPSALATHEAGLSIKEISTKTGITESDVGYYLAKYEHRGWVCSKRDRWRKLWVLQEQNIIKDFKSRKSE